MKKDAEPIQLSNQIGEIKGITEIKLIASKTFCLLIHPALKAISSKQAILRPCRFSKAETNADVS